MSERAKRWILMLRPSDGEIGAWAMVDNHGLPTPGDEFNIHGDPWLVVDPFVTDEEDRRVQRYKLEN